jgi:omega-6 fatty acid desaturase (delta-12 desaturase)
VRHGDIVQSLPAEVFEVNELRAWIQVLITVSTTAFGVYLIYLTPWYLLPIIWLYTGTALTGFFVIGHDCGHRTFSKSNLVNDIVGIFSFLPFFYPFESWRIQHNHHHNNTNKLHVDNAWQPFQPEYYDNAPLWEKAVLRAIRSWPMPFFWIGSIGHWFYLHFSLSLFKPSQRLRVGISVYTVYAVAGLFFPVMLYTFGFWALVKYWLLPWCIFHFWLSTFTLVHHTLPHIPFTPEPKWRNAEARLAGTVHCEYPLGVEFLAHKINVHVPHHVSTRIPSYNLRKAHAILKEKWGEYMNEAVFGWGLMKDILSNCSLYNEQTNYTSFDRPLPKASSKEDSCVPSR